jgi:hypothetical protein
VCEVLAGTAFGWDQEVLELEIVVKLGLFFG